MRDCTEILSNNIVYRPALQPQGFIQSQYPQMIQKNSYFPSSLYIFIAIDLRVFTDSSEIIQPSALWSQGH